MKINKIAGFINNSQMAQKLLKKVNDNPSEVGFVSSFLLASVLRPGLIGLMPFKDKKDKKYSQASAIAAGTVEVAAGLALFTPLNKSIQKSSDNLYKAAGTIYHNNPEILRQYKSITNRGIKLACLVPLSLMRFSLVKPIVNLFFKKDSKPTKTIGMDQFIRSTHENK